MASGSSDHARPTIVTDSNSGLVDHRHINPTARQQSLRQDFGQATVAAVDMRRIPALVRRR
jgi:hypothetical protein